MIFASLGTNILIVIILKVLATFIRNGENNNNF